MDIKIVATTGRAHGEAVAIRVAKFFIGRHENCQLKPNITDLAGIHALLEQREERLYLRDFGAEGGTGINERVLHARETEVFDGDLIQVGPMVLTLAIKPKGAPTTGQAHLRAPEGWPFLEAADQETRFTEDRQARFAQAVAAPTSPRPTPSPRPDLFHAIPEPAPVPVPVQAPAPAVASAPEPVARPIARPTLGTAIPTRQHLHRTLACEMVDGVLVARILPPELNEEATVSPVRYELRSLLDDEPPTRMVIDLGETRYLSSRAVGVILAHYQGLERKGGSLRVCRVSKEIKPVLDQMRLSMLIDIYPTVEEAVSDSWD